MRFLLSSFLFLCLASTVAYPQAFPAQPDNILTAAGSVGLPPGVTTEGDSEIVNLPNGTVNLFIPAVTLRQRSGAKPLVLGFTYNSHVIGYRQDVNVNIGVAPAQGVDESDPLYFYAGADSNTPYDIYTYSEQTIWNAPFNGAFQPTMPILTASVEYEGDAWETTGQYGGNSGSTYNIIPQMCVTNFTFTDWAGTTHPFNNISNCAEGYPGYNNQASPTAAGSILMQSMDATDNSLYHLDTSNPADIQVTDPDGTVYHFTHFRTPYPVFPLSAITGSSQNMPTPQGSSSSEGILEGPTSIVDRNGNTMSISGDVYSGFTITDTVGRQIKLNAFEIDYTDSNGAPQNVSVSTDRTWQSSTPDVGVPVNQSAPCQATPTQFDPPAAQYSINPGYIVDQFVTPNQHELYSLTYSGTNRKLQFELDSFDQLVKVIYPTGGYTRYDYSATTYGSTNGPVQCIWASPRVAHKYQCPNATSDGSSCNTQELLTTYNYGGPNTTSFATQNCPFGADYGYPLANYVTVVDPLGTSTVHCFNAAPSATLGPQETDTYTLDASGNQLSHTQSTFLSAPLETSGGSSVPFPFPSSITTTVKTSAGDVSSSIQRTYDTIGQTVDGGDYAYLRDNGTQVMYPIDNVTDEKQYGFDSTLISHTSTTYWYSGHILDKPQLATLYDPVTGNSRSVEKVYDGQGNVTSVTKSGTNLPSLTTTFTLDSSGRPTTSTDQLGRKTKFGYSDNYIGTTGTVACVPPSTAAPDAFLTSITNALNQTTNYGYYYCTGLMGSVTDPNGNQTIFAYDALERVTASIYPDGGNISSLYNDIPPNTQTTTRRAAPDLDEQTTITFDGFGRKSIVTDGDGDSVQTAYDAIGRVSAISNPYASSPTNWTDYQYDPLDRTTMITDPDGNSSVWCYDGQASQGQTNCSSNQSAVVAAKAWVDITDQAQHHRQESFDADARLIQVTEPNAQSGALTQPTIYTYDGFDDLSNVQQAASGTNAARTRSFVYDSFSRLTSAQNPESGVTTYKYLSANGNMCASDPTLLCSRTDANGNEVDYAYDTLNRLQEKTSPQDGELNQQFTYDQGKNGIGHLSQVYDPIWTGQTEDGTQFNYDAMGRVMGTNWFDYAGQAWRTGIAALYDLAGNLTQLTYPDTSIISQTWDGAARLTSVNRGPVISPGSTYMNNIQYSPSGVMSGATLGNGVTEAITLNSRLQPCHDAASTPLLPANSGYGNLIDRQLFYGQTAETNCGNAGGDNGDVWSIVEGPSHAMYQSFNYDALNRLTGAFSGNRPPSSSYNFLYNYDPFGNMIPVDQLHTPMNYGVDAATNRLTLNGDVNTGDLQYYANGSLKQTPSAAGGYHYLSYTGEGYLRSIDSYQTGSYLTNGLGERTFAAHNNQTSDEYVYFNGQPMADLDNNGNWTDYIYANGQKIARVVSSDSRVHLTATNNPTTDQTRWNVIIMPYPANLIIQPGDVLNFRMYQHNSTGYISWGFTDGSNSDWYCNQCLHPVSQNDQWQNVSIAIGGATSSPGPMAGKTLNKFFMGQMQGGPNGEYDIMIADISLLHADGSITPFPVALGSLPYGGDLTDISNISANSEQVSTSSGAVGAIADSYYYLADQVGTTQMELSSGGWPVWQGWFTPFGQEIVNGGEQNVLGDTPADGTSNRFKFTGKERDSESGLDYFGARYYASNVGRWISSDWAQKPEAVPYSKLDDPQSLNLYEYVGNNPLSKADADGHQEDEGLERDRLFSSDARGPTIRPITPEQAEALGWPTSQITLTSEQMAFRQRYMSGAGGRWGSNDTRNQNISLADLFHDAGYTILGGAYDKEEWIPGNGPGGKGGTYVDLTVTDGKQITRIQTVTLTAEGKLTPEEEAAKERIKRKFPHDELVLIGKLPRRPASSDPVTPPVKIR